MVREGLTFDYPDSTAIIPDPRCRSLRGFLGADWVAQEYLLTPDEIEEIYMVDVGTSYTAYDEDGKSTGYEPTGSQHHYAGCGGGENDGDQPAAAPASGRSTTARTARFTWCATAIPISCRSRARRRPRSPRFWPWFAFVLNEGYDEKTALSAVRHRPDPRHAAGAQPVPPGSARASSRQPAEDRGRGGPAGRTRPGEAAHAPGERAAGTQRAGPGPEDR